jgi:hypothetical protein
MRLRCLCCCGIVLGLNSLAAAQGHPDLTGLWNSTAPSVFVKSDDPLASNLASRDGKLLNFERDFTLVRRADPNKPLYKPQFWEKVQQGDQNGNTDDPSYGCMPAGVPRMGPPAQIVQTPKELVFLYLSPPAQGWGDQYRVIPTDGRPHSPLADLDGTWKGESIGHWEGDTLVVESNGFNGKAWLSGQGYTTTDAMRLTERMHRRDFGHMDIQITFDDPKAYTKPWTAQLHPQLVPDTDLIEFVCNENEKDLGHLVGK